MQALKALASWLLQEESCAADCSQASAANVHLLHMRKQTCAQQRFPAAIAFGLCSVSSAAMRLFLDGPNSSAAEGLHGLDPHTIAGNTRMTLDCLLVLQECGNSEHAGAHAQCRGNTPDCAPALRRSHGNAKFIGTLNVRVR